VSKILIDGFVNYEFYGVSMARLLILDHIKEQANEVL
jgi:hypothetical protein